MNKLPKWVLTSGRPAFYDSESGTAIEMVAKIYGAMNELIDSYNNFVEVTETEITTFEQSMRDEFQLFGTGLRQEFQDFIDIVELRLLDFEHNMEKMIDDKYAESFQELDSKLQEIDTKQAQQDAKINTAIETQNATITEALSGIDTKFAEQDAEIEEATQYMKDNITVAAESVIQDMVESGELTLGTTYNAEDESLVIALEQTGGA